MASGWQEVPFAEILNPISNPVPVERNKTYRILGMRWYAQGLFIKEDKPGQLIQANELFRVEKDDFVYNRLFAWKGSFGIVDDLTAGGYVSGEFPCFHVVSTKADPKFILYYLSQEPIWDEIGRISSGQTSISRLRLKVPDFLGMKIPLPPLDEQRRIVARIEALAARVNEAQRLRKEALEREEFLLRSVLFSKTSGEPAPRPLRELVKLREPDVDVNSLDIYHFAGVYCFGRGVFKGARRKGDEFAYRKLTRLRTNDFTYPKLMAWEGAYGIVPPECDGLVVSTEYPVFELNQELILPETMAIYFRVPFIWESLSGQSTGTNVRRRRLNPSKFLDYKFPLPPMKLQLLLKKIQAKINSIRRLQADSQQELDALLPSILDKAFKGEL